VTAQKNVKDTHLPGVGLLETKQRLERTDMSFFNFKTNLSRRFEEATQHEENSHLRSLAHAVIEAARKLDERVLAPPADANHLAFDSRTLLAMLAFCYARQIYGSADVAARLHRDASLYRLCGDEIPDATTLRRFRGANRGALQFCLKEALRCLVEQKIAAGFITKVNELQLAEEASRRITMAMFTDSLELDTQRAPTGRLQAWMTYRYR